MNQTAKESLIKKTDLSKRVDALYNDPFIKSLNKHLSNIYACHLPKMTLFRDGTITTEHSKEVKDAVDRVESLRCSYMEVYYPELIFSEVARS
jgi:hypothetical protein